MQNIANLLCTQRGLRDYERVVKMCAHARSGEHFTSQVVSGLHTRHESNSLIAIACFPPTDLYPNGLKAAQDGHHRLVAKLLCNTYELYDDEYREVHFDSIDRYSEINLRVGWVTPFNILEEARVPDLSTFKSHVLSLSDEDALAYIATHRHEYCVPRNGIYTIADMVQHLL